LIFFSQVSRHHSHRGYFCEFRVY